MSPHVDKAALLHRLDREYKRFQTLIAPLTPAELERGGVVGAWSIKDVIAHFIAHEQFALQELQHALHGEQYVQPEGDGRRMNDRAVAEQQHQSAADVLRAWDVSHRAVVAAVEDLTEADFDPTGAVVQILDDSIDGALGNNSYDHYAEHRPEVEAWIQQHIRRMP